MPFMPRLIQLFFEKNKKAYKVALSTFFFFYNSHESPISYKYLSGFSFKVLVYGLQGRKQQPQHHW